MCCVLVLCNGSLATGNAIVIFGTLSAPLFCNCNNNSRRDYAMVSRGGARRNIDKAAFCFSLFVPCAVAFLPRLLRTERMEQLNK